MSLREVVRLTRIDKHLSSKMQTQGVPLVPQSNKGRLGHMGRLSRQKLLSIIPTKNFIENILMFT